MKATALLLSFLAVSALHASEPLPVKVVRGLRDTMFTPSAHIICVTEPQAKAFVNGKEVHVYKTGGFEARIDLQPGENQIDILTTKGTRKAGKKLSVFRKEKENAQKTSAHKETRTLMYQQPVFISSLPGAYLQYGNGNDRLGGSKMGFISESIVMKAIGEKGNLYCVRLAPDRIAYINKEYTTPASAGTETVNTGNWTITNTGKSDKVVIRLPRRLPYQSMTDLDPNSITVDLFGATDNSNWMIQDSRKLGIIDYFYFRQPAEDVYRVVLRLKGSLQWGYEVRYEGSNLVIEVRHQPASLKLKDLAIGIDAGHGGDSGACSPSGLQERFVNLDIAQKVDSILRREGTRTVMTRDREMRLSMAERKKILADAHVDLAVSIHNNSTTDPETNGNAIFYKHLFCRPLALAVSNRVLESGLNNFGVVQNFNFSLNAPTLYPECLVEGMFMSNLADEEKLADPKFRTLLAEKIVAGIKDYLRRAEQLNKKSSSK